MTFTPSPYRPLSPSIFSSAGVAGVAIDTRSSFPVAVYAPLHIVSIDHLYRPVSQTRKPVADGAIHSSLDMNPVRENDELRKFVHPHPWDLLTCLHIFDDFKGLRSFADRIARMADSTEFNIWDPCNSIPFDITVAEGTVQIEFLFVNEMIE